MNFLRKNRNSGSHLTNSSELPMSGQLAAGQGGFVQHNTITAAPIIQETVRQDRVIEVQPVLHRSVDRNVVHHVERHIHEAAPPMMGGTIERPAVVQQEVHTNVVNEIQPIIHRERVVPVTERSERHFVERVTGPTVHTHEVIYENGTGLGGYQQQGLYQQQASNQFLQTAQPTINQQPVGILHQTASVPLYAPPMGVPYGSGATTGVAKTGHRHHHGVLHKNH